MPEGGLESRDGQYVMTGAIVQHLGTDRDKPLE